MTFSQRLIPWLYARRIRIPESALAWFGLVGTSAFATLMVENMASFGITEIAALAVALAVSLKSKNLGLTVLSAIMVGMAALVV